MTLTTVRRVGTLFKYLNILAALHNSEIEDGKHSSFKIRSSHEKVVKSEPPLFQFCKPR